MEHSEVTGPEAEPDGYSKYGPGPFDIIRLKWTARRLSDGWYVVDETIGASIPVTSHPMLRHRVIDYIHQRETEALQAHEELKRNMGRRSSQPASSEHIESVVAEVVGMAAFRQNVERSSEVSLAIPPEPVQSHEAVPTAVAAEIGEPAISSPTVGPSSVAEPVLLAAKKIPIKTLHRSGLRVDLKSPSEKVESDPGAAILDGNVQSVDPVDDLAAIAHETAGINQDQRILSVSSKEVPRGQEATEATANTNLIAEPNLSYEMPETGDEPKVGDVDRVLRQLQNMLSRWG